MSFLTDLTKFLAHHCGSLFSARKIAEYLKSQQIKTTPEAIINYLSHLESAFFIHRVKRSDIEGKRLFEIGEKVYFEDLGLRNSLIGYRATDIGKIMENAVYLHLIAHEWEVTVGSNDRMEIDFVATKQGEKLYVQVCYLLQDESTLAREFGNLLSIPDNYPKIVVTLDPLVQGASYRGIAQQHLRVFLSEEI